MQSTRNHDQRRRYPGWTTVAAALWLAFAGHAASAQQSVEPAPAELLSAAELDDLVAPLALYPDDLLAIMLPASTYPLQVVEATRFLEDREQDPTLEPDEEWDDSIIALLNYPEALQLLNDDLDWTWQLGEAVLAQQADVLEAVEVFRDRAYLAGNLASDDYQRVERDDDGIRIVPADPQVIYVPYYDPVRVTVRYPYRAYYYHDHGYPLYYYPYDIGHRFYSSLFWGVSTAFSISWHDRYVHLYYYDHYRHPFYGRRYHADRYFRHRRSIDYHVYAGGVRQRHRGDYYRWYPGRHHGARPRYHRYRADPNRRVLSYDNGSRRQLTRSAERARSINQTRQRYRTVDNVIERDRNRVRRNDNRSAAASGNRQQRATPRRDRDASASDRSRGTDRSSRFKREGSRADRGAPGSRDRTAIARRSSDASGQRQRVMPNRADGTRNRFSRPTPAAGTPRANRAERVVQPADRTQRRSAARPQSGRSAPQRAAPQRSVPQRSAAPRFSRQRAAPQRAAPPRAPAAASRPAPQRYQQRSEPRTSDRPRATRESRSSRQASRPAQRSARSGSGQRQSPSPGKRRER